MKDQQHSPQSPPRRGQKYRCTVCGSEVLVIHSGNGRLGPVCCNKPMALLKQRERMYRCSVCGSEVAAILVRSANLRPVCCNTPMRLLGAKTSEAA